VSDFIQLSTSTDYHIGSKFEVSPAADLHVEIRFYDDAKLGPRNDRNVFIKRVFLTNSNVPILRFPSLDFLPKVGFSGRIPIWRDALKNLADYGPLGVGAGQAKSRGEMSLHTFLLEQYGEGGVLTLMGVLGWLIMPILHIREARISSELGWGIVAMMAGLMVHGLFWSQFLNGLRFLTLVYVSLWTALSTGEAIPRVAR
jgi:hypothetical protein